MQWTTPKKILKLPRISCIQMTDIQNGLIHIFLWWQQSPAVFQSLRSRRRCNYSSWVSIHPVSDHKMLHSTRWSEPLCPCSKLNLTSHPRSGKELSTADTSGGNWALMYLMTSVAISKSVTAVHWLGVPEISWTTGLGAWVSPLQQGIIVHGRIAVGSTRCFKVARTDPRDRNACHVILQRRFCSCSCAGVCSSSYSSLLQDNLPFFRFIRSIGAPSWADQQNVRSDPLSLHLPDRGVVPYLHRHCSSREYPQGQ